MTDRLTDERLRELTLMENILVADPSDTLRLATELLELRKELERLRSQLADSEHSNSDDVMEYRTAMDALRKELDRYKRRFHDAQSKLAEWQEHTGCSCPSAAGELCEENERLGRELKHLRSERAIAVYQEGVDSGH